LPTRVLAVDDDFIDDVSDGEYAGGAVCGVEADDGFDVCGILRLGASREKMDAKDWEFEGREDIET
jgi:hypothetical protein